MAERRQLPPQIRRVELARRAGSKPVVRYQLTVDTGTADGKRKQLRRRYRTEREARAALAEIQGQVNAGTYVQPSTLTVEQATLLLPAYGAVRLRAYVGTTSISASGRCGSERHASMWEVARSTNTTPRLPQLAGCCPYLTRY